MRKRIISTTALQETSPPDLEWLNLDDLAEVEVTSEDASHPIESALLPGQESGWRASAPGEQIIRLLFSTPQRLQRIWLSFEETQVERTQEYILGWSPDGGESFEEIVRQQWNFSPAGSTSETEDLRVELPAVTVLELCIVPDISGGDVFASLQQLRLA